MKMKNMLIGGMSLALVACITIGGTLAYLTSKDAQVTNTFTFGGNIKVDLYEQILEQTSWIGKENTTGTGIFENIVADVNYKKDVDVKVEAKSDAYVFLKIGNDAEEGDVVMTLNNLNAGSGKTWQKLDANSVDAQGYGIYYMEARAATYGTAQIVNVFDSVTLKSTNGQVEIGENGEVADITLQVGAIQTKTDNGKKLSPVEAYNLAQDSEVIDWTYEPAVVPAP